MAAVMWQVWSNQRKDSLPPNEWKLLLAGDYPGQDMVLRNEFQSDGAYDAEYAYSKFTGFVDGFIRGHLQGNTK